MKEEEVGYRIITIVVVVFLSAFDLSASCGGPPTTGTVVPEEEQVLRDSLENLFSQYEEIAVAQVVRVRVGSCTPPEGMGYCSLPCSVDIVVTSVLEGAMKTGDEQTFVVFAANDGTVGSYWAQYPGKSFLLYGESLPLSHITLSAGCYSFANSYFVSNDEVTNYAIAYGHAIPLSDLVGIRSFPTKPNKLDPQSQSRRLCNVQSGLTGIRLPANTYSTSGRKTGRIELHGKGVFLVPAKQK